MIEEIEPTRRRGPRRAARRRRRPAPPRDRRRARRGQVHARARSSRRARRRAPRSCRWTASTSRTPSSSGSGAPTARARRTRSIAGGLVALLRAAAGGGRARRLRARLPARDRGADRRRDPRPRATCRSSICEGNYLLLDDGAWRGVRPLLDACWFVEADERVRLDRLVRRHVEFGKEPAYAAAWVERSDQVNARLIATDPRARRPRRAAWTSSGVSSRCGARSARLTGSCAARPARAGARAHLELGRRRAPARTSAQRPGVVEVGAARGVGEDAAGAAAGDVVAVAPAHQRVDDRPQLEPARRSACSSSRPGRYGRRSTSPCSTSVASRARRAPRAGCRGAPAARRSGARRRTGRAGSAASSARRRPRASARASSSGPRSRVPSGIAGNASTFGSMIEPNVIRLRAGMSTTPWWRSRTRGDRRRAA